MANFSDVAKHIDVVLCLSKRRAIARCYQPDFVFGGGGGVKGKLK